MAQNDFSKSKRQLIEDKEKALAEAAARSEFLANMSHEIRTPLNAIIGMADLLSETELSKEQEKYVKICQRAGSNLLSLVNDIIDLTCIDLNHLQVKRGSFDLYDLLERVGEVISLRCRQKGIGFESQIQPDVPQFVEGDAKRIEQILNNLLENAVKFTVEGKVRFEVHRLDGLDEQAKLRFVVKDTGIGITEGQKKRIFKKFKQGDSSMTRPYEGVGLGLSIARALVEMMEGKIGCESQLNQGSEFFVELTLPVSEILATAEVRSVAKSLRGSSILVVSGISSEAIVVESTLKELGAKVTVTSDLQDGMDLFEARTLRRETIDLIVFSENFKKDGEWQPVVEWQQKKEHFPPVLVITEDYQRVHSVFADRNDGPEVVIERPVRSVNLISAVGKALNKFIQLKIEDETGNRRPEKRLLPKKILLAEDSEDNRLLVQAYLNEYDIQVEVAIDGKEALGKFRQQRFDAVLMDIQMPVMDGYTATRKMREWEKEKGLLAVPIIAMTAHAFENHKNECLLAGCSSYMSKPFNRQELIEMLSESGAANKDKKSLETDFDMADLIPVFLKNRRKDIESLKRLADEGDLKGVERIGHTIKGISRPYGFVGLEEIGRQIEQAAADQPEALTGLCQEMEIYLDRVDANRKPAGNAVR